jgi:exopolysaccharide biosynthesis polyprenyl glycosylphosphotransferase
MIQKQSVQRRFYQMILLAADALSLGLAFTIALLVRFRELSLNEAIQEFVLSPKFIFVYVIFVFSFYLFDLYEPRSWRSSLFSPLKTALAVVLATLLMFSWFYFFSAQTAGVYGRGVFLGSVFLVFLAALLSRLLIYRSEQSRNERQTWLFLGDRASFEQLVKDIERLKVAKSMVHQGFDKSEAELEQILQKEWTGVIVAPMAPTQFNKILMGVRLKGQAILSLQNFYEFNCGKLPVNSLDDSWFAFSEGFSILHSPLSVRLKRLSDIVISLILLIISSPIMLLTAILIRLESRGSPLYTQTRVGQHGTLFVMHKFRSMCTNAETSTGAKWAEKNDARVTHVGRLIRKIRLDELPQLYNILKGDMSFVGPRPERPEFTAKLREQIPFYDFRHLVKPGLTGWAQVMYPYGASVDDAREKLQYELFYIKNYSFELDIEIVLKTVSVVLFGAGR